MCFSSSWALWLVCSVFYESLAASLLSVMGEHRRVKRNLAPWKYLFVLGFKKKRKKKTHNPWHLHGNGIKSALSRLSFVLISVAERVFLPSELSSIITGKQVLVTSNLSKTLCHRDWNSMIDNVYNAPKNIKNVTFERAQQFWQSWSSPSPPQWIWIPILI